MYCGHTKKRHQSWTGLAVGKLSFVAKISAYFNTLRRNEVRHATSV